MASAQINKTVALTGATGFIGPYIITALVNAGYQVRALTRRAQPPQSHVTWIEGQLDDEQTLQELLKGADAVIHAAGAIKARSKAEFFHINEYVSTLIAKTALANDIRNFLLISSLAAREPSLSDYAASKAAGEDTIRSVFGEGHPWLILRPPAVFGPGDQETLKIFKSINSGFAPLLHHEAKAAWIYVEDLADACVTALNSPDAHFQTLELDDGSGGYLVKDSHKMVADLLGKTLRLVHIPRALLFVIGAANEIWAKISGKAAMLTRGKARELSHEDWGIEGPTFADKSNWTPKTSLYEGLEKSLAWYKDQGLL